MASSAETAQSIRAALEPFVRPREEAARIRRVLAAHLAACLKSDGALEGSLALVDVSLDPAPSAEVRGLQRAYLRALQANLDARRAFDETSLEATRQQQQYQKQRQQQLLAADGASAQPGGGALVLEGHLEAVRLTRKKARLQAVQRSLDALVQQPAAAAEDFLQQEAIYAEATRTLPPVPKAVVDGLAEDAAAAAKAAVHHGEGQQPSRAASAAAAVTDLKGLVAQLDKAVLRAQLLLRQEEKQLVAARARAAVRGSGGETLDVKRQALGTARDALIGWMEEEMGKAAAAGRAGHDNNNEDDDNDDDDDDDDDDDEDQESLQQLRQSLLGGGGDGGIGAGVGLGKQQIDEEVAAIREKYAQYVEARRQLVQMASSSKPSVVAPLFANMPKLQPWLMEPVAMARARTAETTTTRAADSSRSPPPASAHDAAATTAATATAATATAATATAAAAAAAEAASRMALSHVLLTPYLERLLAVARQQRAHIVHKSHHHAVLARRLRDTCQTLDHAADESQLLPRHPFPGGLDPSGGRHLSHHVTVWTYAADAAKLATFEAVAEQLERGEAALEQAAQTLDEVDLLLGRHRGEDGSGEGGRGGGREDNGSKRHGRESKKQGTGDVWETIHGELGLIRTEKTAR